MVRERFQLDREGIHLDVPIYDGSSSLFNLATRLIGMVIDIIVLVIS